MAYATKYTVPFHSIKDESGEFRIQEENYSGSSSELTGAVPPVARSGKGDNDELEDRIIRTECKVRVNSLTDYQFLELFTADAKKYRGQLFVDSALKWQGYLTPDYYSEPYVPAPYEVELLFTDGLGQLKNQNWDIKDSLLEEGSTSNLITIAAALKFCIEKTRNILPYTEAVNILEENMETSVSMVKQAYFDIRRFKDMNCYDVLDELLKTCNNARLWQQAGRWWIVPINVMKETYAIRNYSTSFNTFTEGEIDPRITIDSSTNVFLDEPELLMLPAWRNFTLKQDLGYNPDLLKNKIYTKSGDWSTYQTGNFIYISTLAEVGDPRGYLEFDLGQVVINTGSKGFLEIAFKWYGPKDVKIGLAVILDRAPYEEYSLELESNLEYAEWDAGYRSVFNLTGDEDSAKVRSRDIPYSGNLKLRIVQPVKIPGGTETSGLIGFNLDDLNVSFSIKMDVAEENVITTEINDDQNYIPEEYIMMLGDFAYPLERKYSISPAPTPGGITQTVTVIEQFPNQELVYLGGLYWLNGTTFTKTAYWKKSGSNDLKHLVNLIADEICVNHLRPMGMISGNLRCSFQPGSVIRTAISSDKLFIIKRFTEDFYSNEWECDLVEYADVEQGYLKLRSGGYLKLRNGGKIKLR